MKRTDFPFHFFNAKYIELRSKKTYCRSKAVNLGAVTEYVKVIIVKIVEAEKYMGRFKAGLRDEIRGIKLES